LAQQQRVHLFRGSLQDVLDPYYQAAKVHNPAYVVRLTADCPLADPTVIDLVVQLAISHDCDFASNCFIRTYPHGLDVEVMTFSTLETL
jgi:glutamate-1-semialdehyde 2,1-aminomutase